MSPPNPRSNLRLPVITDYILFAVVGGSEKFQRGSWFICLV